MGSSFIVRDQPPIIAWHGAAVRGTQADLLSNYDVGGSRIADVIDVLRVGFGIALIFSCVPRTMRACTGRATGEAAS